MIQFVGTTFPRSFQWHTDEIDLISKIKDQITVKYKNSKNLFINTTWFGPQFDNGEYNKFIDLVNNQQFDNLFLLAAAVPVFLNRDQISELAIQSGASQIFLIGHFDTDYYFNFHRIGHWVIEVGRIVLFFLPCSEYRFAYLSSVALAEGEAK